MPSSFQYRFANMIIAETDRLIIRHFNENDAEYVLKQLNETSFIHFIADKGVRNIADAIKYLNDGPISSYQKFGYGLNIVTLRCSGEAIGMCGLVDREELKYPDLGFAFLPMYWRKGYAKEACEVVLDDARGALNLDVVLGITLPDNHSSNTLLTKLGFIPKGTTSLYGTENNLYEKSLKI